MTGATSVVAGDIMLMTVRVAGGVPEEGKVTVMACLTSCWKTHRQVKGDVCILCHFLAAASTRVR